jgi:tRNA-guanine family transglycosylase
VSGEIVALRVLSLHNLHFLAELMRAMRAAIREGRAQAFVKDTLEQMRLGDQVGPVDEKGAKGDPRRK